jgi:hypothetical protein
MTFSGIWTVSNVKPCSAATSLPGGFALRPTVDLGHQEHFVPITVLERLTHPKLASAVVVVPGVVHESDAPIDRGAYDANAQPLLDLLEAEMPPAEADRGNSLAGAAQQAIRHVGVR